MTGKAIVTFELKGFSVKDKWDDVGDEYDVVADKLRTAGFTRNPSDLPFNSVSKSFETTKSLADLEIELVAAIKKIFVDTGNKGSFLLVLAPTNSDCGLRTSVVP